MSDSDNLNFLIQKYPSAYKHLTDQGTFNPLGFLKLQRQGFLPSPPAINNPVTPPINNPQLVNLRRNQNAKAFSESVSAEFPFPQSGRGNPIGKGPFPRPDLNAGEAEQAENIAAGENPSNNYSPGYGGGNNPYLYMMAGQAATGLLEAAKKEPEEQKPEQPIIRS